MGIAPKINSDVTTHAERRRDRNIFVLAFLPVLAGATPSVCVPPEPNSGRGHRLSYPIPLACVKQPSGSGQKETRGIPRSAGTTRGALAEPSLDVSLLDSASQRTTRQPPSDSTLGRPYRLQHLNFRFSEAEPRDMTLSGSAWKREGGVDACIRRSVKRYITTTYENRCGRRCRKSLESWLKVLAISISYDKLGSRDGFSDYSGRERSDDLVAQPDTTQMREKRCSVLVGS